MGVFSFGGVTMSRTRNPMSIAVGLLCLVVTAGSAQNTLVDVGGHKLNVRVAGTAFPGVPTVVFESGLGSPLAAWASVPSSIAGSARTIAYERAGIGQSERGTEPPTVKHIVAELHTLLGKLNAPPPYILVGHSWGGPIIHMFAGTYPKEVAGLVYVDPTDFTQTEADMLAVWETAGAKDPRDALAKSSAANMMPPGAPAGVMAEAREVQRAQQGGFAELRAAGDGPDVPTVILLAGKTDPLPPNLPPFPADFAKFFQANLDQRVEHFGLLARRAGGGTLVLTSKSSHFVQLSEPELVVWGIQRVLSATSSHAELQRFVGEYTLTPDFVMTVTRDGGKLSLQATAQPAFVLTPESATTFSIKVVDAVIEFETDPTGKVTALVLVQNGARQRAPKTK